MMKCLGPDTGELKRVFVTEEARGTGTGRALIEAREKVAREMGLNFGLGPAVGRQRASVSS